MLSTPITYALRVFTRLYPTQKPLVFSGVGSTQKLANLMVAAGQSKPLLITDNFLLTSGMLDETIAHLKDKGCEVIVFDDIVPNPTFQHVEKAIKATKQNSCDSIFAIGGGSVIDVAKVVAAAVTNDKSLHKLTGLLKVKTPPLPLYITPTTSGTGSEVTNAAVISDTETHKKKFFVDSQYLPIAAALDPELLKSLPAHITAAVGMDALTHAIEAFTSKVNSAEVDRDAALAIKLLFDHLPKVCADGNDLHARETVAQASFLAGYSFSKSSLGYVHAISHQISAHYNTPHGLANAVILPRVLEFNKVTSAKRLAKLELMLSGKQESKDIQTLAENFLGRVNDLAKTIGIPSSLPEIKQSDFKKITKDALAEARASYAVPKVMRRKDVEAILNSVSNEQTA